MALSALEIPLELIVRMPQFKKADADRKATCVRIAQFLENGGLVDQRLVQLENAMIAHMNLLLIGGVGIVPGDVAATFANRVNERPIGGLHLASHMRSVLSEVLAQAEILRGFKLYNVNGRQKPVLYTDFVQPTEFRRQIGKKRPFKDPTVPNGHGEFTHRIQWYLVMTAVQAPAIGWSAFYSWVASVVHTSQAKGDPSDWANLGLWDALFDRNKSNRPGANGPYDTVLPTDARSPENLHKHIRHMVTCPVLAGFIEGRHRKRKNQGLIPMTPGQQGFSKEVPLRDYLSRKLFGVPYTDLPLADRNTLATSAPNKVLKPAASQPVSVEGTQGWLWRNVYNAIGW